MKVAISGTAGFIGSNLTDACLKKGWEVVAVDNLSTGYMEMADPGRYIGFPGEYSFMEMDINETKKLIDVIKGCEIFFHLAARPRVSFSVDHPLEAHEANATGTVSVLEASRLAGVKRVIFACSSSIFGGTNEFPTTELAPIKPLSPYALQKSQGLAYCDMYSKLYGLETCSLIYFNVYGKYQRTGANSAYATCIPAFFDAAMRGVPCRIDGDGLQSRDYSHVDNVVAANILAAEYKYPMLGERFNIANGGTHSVLEVYAVVKELTGVDLEKYHVPPRIGDPRKSHASISRAESILLYKPVRGFYDGMRETAKWWVEGCKI